jgi:hypothetical protein
LSALGLILHLQMQTLPGVGMPGGHLFIQLDADLEGIAADDVLT